MSTASFRPSAVCSAKAMRSMLSPPCLEVAVDPRRGELLADPCGVGVDDLTEEKFCTDFNDLGSHGLVGMARRHAT